MTFKINPLILLKVRLQTDNSKRAVAEFVRDSFKMTLSAAVLLCFIFGVTYINAQVPCPFAQECICRYAHDIHPFVSVSCHVSSIPNFEQADLKIGQLEIFGNLTNIPSNAFYNLNTTIAELVFQHSGPDTGPLAIESGAFAMAEIGQITSISFYDFKNLLSLPDDFGYSSVGLFQLHIQRCGIETIKAGTFNGTQLSVLSISHSNLRLIEQGAFIGLNDTLQYIDFSNNQLSEIPEDFIGLSVASTFVLQGNSINEIPDLAFPQSTSEIDLSNNPLNETTFTNNTFGGISLFRLVLSGCGLTKVPNVLYSDSFIGIFYFDLTNNQIKELTADAFPAEYFNSTTSLPSLNNNPIEAINENAFSAFTNVFLVTLVNLYNLKSINLEIFSPMSNLGTVNIQDCRKLVNITLPDEVQLPRYLTSVTIEYSDLISNLDSNFGKWLNMSPDNGLSLPNNKFRCTDSLQWMYEYEYCDFHPRIDISGSKCHNDDGGIPLNEYLFKMGKTLTTCQ